MLVNDDHVEDVVMYQNVSSHVEHVRRVHDVEDDVGHMRASMVQQMMDVVMYDDGDGMVVWLVVYVLLHVAYTQ